jgi:hypothetical protein
VPSQADRRTRSTPVRVPAGTGASGRPSFTALSWELPAPSASSRKPIEAGEHRFLVRRALPRGATRRTLSICGWATGLGVVGLGSALRGLPAIMAATTPDWYQPTLAVLGLSGIGLTTAAFVAIRRRRLPWLLLALATLPLGLNVGLTAGML